MGGDVGEPGGDEQGRDEGCGGKQLKALYLSVRCSGRKGTSGALISCAQKCCEIERRLPSGSLNQATLAIPSGVLQMP